MSRREEVGHGEAVEEKKNENGIRRGRGYVNGRWEGKIRRRTGDELLMPIFLVNVGSLVPIA